jgi:hypothetical protein
MKLYYKIMISNYQLSEIILGSIYFSFLYILISYIFTNIFDLWDIISTSILFFLWFLLTKLITNYFSFIGLSQ